MKTHCVEITVLGGDDSTPEALKYAVETFFLSKTIRFPPDSKFVWSTAKCAVVDFEKTKTPAPVL